MSKYNTDELVKAIGYHIIEHDRPLREEEANAIIARLRAGDRLRDKMAYLANVMTSDILQKVAVDAIDDYEDK